MIAELPPSNFKNLIPLFPEVFYNLSSLAVLNKDISGRVWVDNPDNPETCMIVDIEWSIHLGGLHTNKRFNEHAGEVIRSKIFPEAQHHANQIYGNGQVGEWVIYVSNNAWLPKVENEMKIDSFLPLRRCYYVYNSLNLDILNWKSTLPTRYSIHKFDSKIIQSLKRTSFLEDLETRVKASWTTLDNFFSHGIGFFIAKNKTEIVSWAISDWITDNKTELGVETDESYRMQGLASVVCSAFVEHCQKLSIEIGWHCSEHNEASWKTAEKVGFVKKRDYVTALRYYDDDQNLWENAWYNGLYLNNLEKGLQFINKLLERVEPEARYLSIKAQILIGIGDNDLALESLFQTVDLGLQNPKRFKTMLLEEDIFKPLHSLENFPQLLKKIDGILH